jgi:hypothetical protein
MSKQKRRHSNSVEERLHFATPHVDGFQKWLRDRGYTASTIVERVRLLAGWADWMQASGFTLDNVLDGLTASAAAFKGKKSTRALGRRRPTVHPISSRAGHAPQTSNATLAGREMADLWRIPRMDTSASWYCRNDAQTLATLDHRSPSNTGR